MKISIINFGRCPSPVHLVVGSVRWRTRNIQGGRYLSPGKSDPDMADRQGASHTNKVEKQSETQTVTKNRNT